MILPVSAFSFAEDTDIESHWAKNEIEYLLDKKIVSGYSDGSFKPDKSITRAEFFKVINGVFGYSEKAEIAFEDVKAEDWFFDDVAKAVAAGYVNGYEDGTMKPNKPITRQEVAKIISIAYGIQNQSSNSAYSFNDESSIENWAVNYVGIMKDKGFITGYSDGTFGPKKNITRGEVAKIISNASGEIVSTAGEYSKDAKGNLIVNASGVVLKDMTIEGDLYLAEGIGNGDVTLNGVNVKGQVFVRGGGENSIHIANSKIKNMIIVKTSDNVRVVFGENVEVENIEVDENTIIVVEKGAKIKNLKIKGQAKIEIQEGAEVETLEVDSENVEIESKGTIGKLVAKEEVKVNGTAVKKGAETKVEAGKIKDTKKEETTTTPSTGASTGGGSSSDDDDDDYDKPSKPSTVAVTGVALSKGYSISASKFKFQDQEPKDSAIEDAVQVDVWKMNNHPLINAHAGASSVEKAVLDIDIENNIMTISGEIPNLSKGTVDYIEVCTDSYGVKGEKIIVDPKPTIIKDSKKYFEFTGKENESKPEYLNVLGGEVTIDGDKVTLVMELREIPDKLKFNKENVPYNAKEYEWKVVIGAISDSTEMLLEVGETRTINAIISPSNATNKKVTWSSSDEKVATVDANGKVTAVGVGEATITVKTEDGGKTAKCYVTVEENMYKVTLSSNLEEGGTVTKAVYDEVYGGYEPSNVNHFKVGDKIQVEAKAKEGYDFVNWTDAGNKEVSTDNPYTFTMPAKDVKLTANFKAEEPEVPEGTHKVTLLGDLEAKITVTKAVYSEVYSDGYKPHDDNYFKVGDKIQVKAKATKEGYKFVNWTDAGNNVVSTDSQYEFTIPENKDVVLTANFKKVN